MYKVQYDTLGNTLSTPARRVTPFGHIYESKVPFTRHWLDAQILYPPSAGLQCLISSTSDRSNIPRKDTQTHTDTQH